MIRSKRHLKYLLGFSFGELKELARDLNAYYNEFQEIKRSKNGNPKIDKNGEIEKRDISASLGILKEVQKRIKERIFDRITLSKSLHGGIKKRDNLTNAKVHKGKKYHFQTDLKKFFDRIPARMVYDILLKKGFSYDIAHLITKLILYKNKVPQGAPTSSHIANLVFFEVDEILEKFCKQNSIVYTRFVDDLNFSSSKDFKHLTPEIVTILQENGFKINQQKTFYKVGPIGITGIITKNNVLDLPEIFNSKMVECIENKIDSREIGLQNYYRRVKNT